MQAQISKVYISCDMEGYSGIPTSEFCNPKKPHYDEALANTKQAIQLWIDTAKEFGDPIPEPKDHRLIFA